MPRYFDQYTEEQQSSLRAIVTEELGDVLDWEADATIQRLMDWGKCGVSPISGAWFNSSEDVQRAYAQVQDEE